MRSALDDAWDAVSALASPELRVKLRAEETTARARIASGSIIASTAGNGRTVAFSNPGLGAPSPAETVEMWRDLVDLYDRVKTSCALTTDATIYAEMMQWLHPTSEVYSDHSMLCRQ